VDGLKLLVNEEGGEWLSTVGVVERLPVHLISIFSCPTIILHNIRPAK
jgi:hypothetical protein